LGSVATRFEFIREGSSGSEAIVDPGQLSQFAFVQLRKRLPLKRSSLAMQTARWPKTLPAQAPVPLPPQAVSPRPSAAPTATTPSTPAASASPATTAATSATACLRRGCCRRNSQSGQRDSLEEVHRHHRYRCQDIGQGFQTNATRYVSCHCHILLANNADLDMHAPARPSHVGCCRACARLRARRAPPAVTLVVSA
jgi:hypothetical protein